MPAVPEPPGTVARERNPTVTRREHELDLADAEHHRKAAHHFTTAAHEHTKAAEADPRDDHAGAAHHAHLPYGH